MSDRIFERTVRDWLDDGSDRTPRPAIDAVLLAIKTTPQVRAPWSPWRFTHMPSYMRLAAAIAVVAIVGAGAIWYLGRAPGVGPPASSPTPIATAAPSPDASTTAAPTSTALDTGDWVAYISARYGIELAYPPDWTVQPADHDWSWEDDATDWLSSGHDAFVAPGAAIRVSVWTVPLDAPVEQSWAAMEAWAIEYCERTANRPCTGIHERIVPMCIEKRDCHPAVIVPFDEDVQFFGHGGVLPEGMTVVAVWRPEGASAVAPYGGSKSLLEAFLSTMDVWPPFYPESQEAAATFLATGP